MKLSAVIITKDVARDLRRCLASLDFVDEIVVLDSGSSDETVAVAEAAGANVFHSTDWPGFGPQRQRAQQYAQGEWLLWVDADEVITPALKASIINALDNDKDGTVYRFNRLSQFLGQWIYHSGWHPDRIVRLYRQDEYHYDDAQVHEKVACAGAKVVDLPGILEHYTCQDLAQFQQKQLRYARQWAEQRAARGKKAGLASILVRPAFRFIRQYLLKGGFLDGLGGFVLAKLEAQYVFNKYVILWALSRR